MPVHSLLQPECLRSRSQSPEVQNAGNLNYSLKLHRECITIHAPQAPVQASKSVYASTRPQACPCKRASARACAACSSKPDLGAEPAPPRIDFINTYKSPENFTVDTFCSAPSSGQTLKEEGWFEELQGAFPFSWAVLTSDACRVLHHGLGLEPAAAQLLQQVLLPEGIHPVAPAVGSPCAKPGRGFSASSFLAALLGPQLEAVALETAKIGRPWKGSISVQLPATKHTSDSSARCSIHISPAPSAAAEEEEQRAAEVTVRVRTEKASSFTSRQQSRKSNVTFQSAGLDEGRSHGGAEESAKGLRWDCLPISDPDLATQDPPVQPGSKGARDRLPAKFEGNYEMARNRSPDPCPNLDCTAHLIGIHARGEGHLNLEEDAPSARASSAGNRQLRGSRSLGSHGRRSSLRLSEKEIEDFMRQDEDESPNLRTRAFLKSLSHAEYRQAESPAKHGSRLPNLDNVEHIAQQTESRSALTQSEMFETEIESLDQKTDKDLDAKDATGSVPQPQSGSIEGSAMHSFDVVVSPVDRSKGNRSPLTVVITDSTEHLKARAVLTALAESQLELLEKMMPQHVIQFLAMESSEAVPERVGQLARAHESVTLMFMDVCGFTEMSKEVEPHRIMVFLNTLFSRFDKLVDVHGVHKVETAGDCYIISGGIMKQAEGLGQMVVEESHDPVASARRVMDFAIAILDAAGQVEMPNQPHQPVRVRIGMHSGDVVSGMIGTKLPKFSLFGDAMCTASRMESTGVPGRIHVSKATRDLLQEEMWEATGGVEVKGKGCMESYLWLPHFLKFSDGHGFDASPSIPLPSLGLGNAEHRVQGNSLPLPALSPALRLLCSPQSSRANMSCDMLKEWERGWETYQSISQLKEISGWPTPDAVAASSSMLPSEIIKATQTLSRSCKMGGK
ncbi:adenylate and guanylate cyclase catalytic domain-containing protein [Dunaliella salina]|uniref:Adenylate and guanylate cyclase catalytic domain-containing protein n=1 Tax=Dunaliella salina TaxID=3046 RepID=A0ABQ7H7D3_DUNSA|nr:adenylate and guanylate cyclase catalytic domain-containing protein [Dunaliella salina]|eukprot:KAF5842754.1 adenylate and guanylate cyclase catalytic domain-containing protein [Dunaliella salina]